MGRSRINGVRRCRRLDRVCSAAKKSEQSHRTHWIVTRLRLEALAGGSSWSRLRLGHQARNWSAPSGNCCGVGARALRAGLLCNQFGAKGAGGKRCCGTRVGFCWDPNAIESGASFDLVALDLQVKTASRQAEFSSGPGNVALVFAQGLTDHPPFNFCERVGQRHTLQ